MVEALKHQGDPSWGTREPVGTTTALGADGKPQQIDSPYSATVLVRVLFGSLPDAYQNIKQLPDLSEVHLVAGDYDMVVRVKSDTYSGLITTVKGVMQLQGLSFSPLIPLDEGNVIPFEAH